MTLEEIYKGYGLNDGQVKSFTIDFSHSGSSVTIALNIRKHIRKQQYEPCTITLVFMQVAEVDISEDFRTQGGYTNIVLTQLDSLFYLSVDPYGNSGQPSDNDNFVIKARQLSFVNETGVNQIIF